VPELRDAQFERTWTGLRPGSADGKPYLGLAPGWKNLFVAAGHYRNGILLTPITAKVMRESLIDGASSIDLTPLAVGRQIAVK
jgi:glycine oxidase